MQCTDIVCLLEAIIATGEFTVSSSVNADLAHVSFDKQKLSFESTEGKPLDIVYAEGKSTDQCLQRDGSRQEALQVVSGYADQEGEDVSGYHYGQDNCDAGDASGPQWERKCISSYTTKGSHCYADHKSSSRAYKHPQNAITEDKRIYVCQTDLKWMVKPQDYRPSCTET